ncbi:hypothetical protein [Thiofilum sp.]|uniref:hypothetical protein n=1 Tax=Thiofilum sp. TaxID=2212733 RepID=UPI0025F50807|nr:hypothetical protein [Thiofilum sp.]
MGKMLLHISQALVELNKRTNYTWTWEDILRHHANQHVPLYLQCKLENVPYIIPHYEYESSEYCALCARTTHYTVGVFNGYVDLTRTEDGVKYLKALANQAPTKGFFSFIDSDEQHYSIADIATLNKIIDEYMCEPENYEMLASLKLEFEDLPTGTLTLPEPTEKYFYIQDFILELFIEWFNKDNSYKSDEKELKVVSLVTNNYQVNATFEDTKKDTSLTASTTNEVGDSKDKPFYYLRLLSKLNIVDQENAKAYLTSNNAFQNKVFKKVIKDLGLQDKPNAEGKIILAKEDLEKLNSVLSENGFTATQIENTRKRNHYYGEDNAPVHNQKRKKGVKEEGSNLRP